MSRCAFVVGLAAIALSGVWTSGQVASRAQQVPRWGTFEGGFTAARAYDNPLQDVELRVTFTAPSRRSVTVPAFWDGGATWRVRFSPDEVGSWSYATSAAPETDGGLHGKTGAFKVTPPSRGGSRFERHGPVGVSPNRRYLQHADGTPFFWLADTGWNAALLSTTEEWKYYVGQRARQRFTAVQWVATQWRASPTGDRDGALAFSGQERIAVNPDFFRRLDARVTSMNDAGLLAVPVMLWAIGGGSNPAINPGFSLPEDQAIRLARYMVARWQGFDVAWILGGDGDYRGDKAEKWKRIGRGVFGDLPHAPVIMHPGGMHWVLREFQNEPWVDVHGYQSGHGDDDKTLKWMTEGPPSADWTIEPARPFINLEPPYEDHVAYQSRTRIPPLVVRRAVYWSLLNAPTAGVTYGGHGVWGWDDGSTTPTDHPTTGVPKPWKAALTLPGAREMTHAAELFTSIDFWRLRPAPQMLAQQPGRETPRQFITAAASDTRDLAVVYSPEAATIALVADEIPQGPATWFNPRTGARTKASPIRAGSTVTFEAPAAGDWVLLVQRTARTRS